MSNIVENQIDGGCLSAEGATTKRHSIVARLWLKAYRWAKRWNERRKAANTLARLNGDQLKDIGLRRDDIKRDYSRPFLALSRVKESRTSEGAIEISFQRHAAPHNRY